MGKDSIEAGQALRPQRQVTHHHHHHRPEASPLSIAFECSWCQAKMRTADANAGRSTNCRECGAKATVPGTLVPAAPIAPPPAMLPIPAPMAVAQVIINIAPPPPLAPPLAPMNRGNGIYCSYCRRQTIHSKQGVSALIAIVGILLFLIFNPVLLLIWIFILIVWAIATEFTPYTCGGCGQANSRFNRA